GRPPHPGPLPAGEGATAPLSCYAGGRMGGRAAEGGEGEGRAIDTRARAAELYVKALRTGEASATTQAARYLAPDVVLDTTGAHMWGNGAEHFSGYDDVVHMITGIGVMTGVYRTGAWDEPEVDGDQVRVSADLGGGLLQSASLTFTFNADGKIVHIEQVNTGGSPPPQTDRIPAFVKAIVNAA